MSTETKEDKLLLATLNDKLRQCEAKAYPTNSTFLDVRQQELAKYELAASHASYLFWGGYAGAERQVVIFLPEYMDNVAAKASFGSVYPENNPLAVLRVTPAAKTAGLSHRDYLGALLSLGIERARLGDILVRPEGADIVILRELADFLQLNFTRAGRHELAGQVLDTNVISAYEAASRDFAANVPSLRLDSVAAAAFGVSRSKCSDAIEAKLLAINGLVTARPDHNVAEGDRITWRGKGKAELSLIGGRSKKGRIFITLKRYI